MLVFVEYAADAVMYGLELQGTWTPVPQASITANYSYLNAEFTDEQEDEIRGIDIAAHSEFAYLTDEDPVDLGAPRP